MPSTSQKLRWVLASTSLFRTYQWAVGATKCHRRFIEEYVRPGSKDRILDLGCGFGASVEYLPGGVEYVGIDISLQYIAAARQRFAHRGTFICSAIEAVTPEQLGQFDLAISFGVVHHLDDESVRRMLQLVSKTVRAGGRLVTIDPCYAANQPALARFLMRHDRGRFIRDAEGYRRLYQEQGDPDMYVVSDMLRIPYTQAITTLWL